VIRPAWKLVGLLVLSLACAGGAWQVQDWRYGKRLAEQASLHQSDLDTINNAAAAQVRADQVKRRALEQRLSASDQSHYKELSDAQTNQARLRDRLATADLRLSVILDQGSTSGCSVPTGTGAGSLVHGGARAQLDRAHAQRIIGITDDGDRGLIALRACQAYVSAINQQHEQ